MQEHHKARRRFGQNFLIDQHTISHILQSVSVQAHQDIVEIGPGLGALTAGLAEQAGTFTMIELDRDLAAKLQQKYADHKQVRLIQQDALKVDLSELSTQLKRDFPAVSSATETQRKLRIVGNLPYNISTPLMFHIFKHAKFIQDMTFMLQREVAARILATPGSSNYGRLSVMAQFYCDGEWVLDVPPEAFKPAPKVHSAVIKLTPHPLPLSSIAAQECFARIVREAFSQRRKTLRNGLRNSLNAEQIESAGIQASQRPETLSLDDFVRLSQVALKVND